MTRCLTQSQGRYPLKLPNTGNRGLPRNAYSWTPVSYLHSAQKSPQRNGEQGKTSRDSPVLFPDNVYIRAPLLKLKDLQLPLLCFAQFNYIAVTFSTISMVSFFVPPLFRLFSKKASRSHKAKQGQEEPRDSLHPLRQSPGSPGLKHR